MTDPAARPSTVGRPPRADLVLMGIGVLAVVLERRIPVSANGVPASEPVGD